MAGHIAVELFFFHCSLLLLGEISLELIGSNQVTKKVNLNKSEGKKALLTT